MRTILIPIIALLSAGAVCVQAEQLVLQKTVHASMFQPYLDKNTGLEFPARIGGFQKIVVRINPNPAIGNVVRYKNETGACADVYVYSDNPEGKPVAESALPSLFRTICGRILAMPNGKEHLVSSVEQLPNEHEADANEDNKPFTARFLIRVKEESVISRVRLTIRNGWIMKLRISCDSEDPEEERNAIEFEKAILALKPEKTVK